MKKFICLLLMLVLTFSLASCNLLFPDNSGTGNTDPTPDPDPNPNPNPNPNPGPGEEGVSGKEKIINVYLIAGQSNAVGYGKDTAGVIAKSDERFTKGFDNVLYYGSQERWFGAYPNQVFEPLKLGMGVSSECSGAEIGIASAIANDGGLNAVIKCAWGATHLYPDTQYNISLQQGTWTSPSYIEKNNVDLSRNPLIGNMYNRFEETVKNGIQLLIEDGYTPVIKGVWWMQGEAEMFTLEMSSAYRELFETLIKDTRNMLGEATGYDCSYVPFVCGLPKWNTNNGSAPTYQKAVREAMMSAATRLDNVGYVDCMPLIQHDDWHFDAAGQKYLGEHFVAAVKEFEAASESGITEKLSIDNEIKLLATENGLEFRANLTSYNSKDANEYGFIVLPTKSLADSGITSQFLKELEEKGIDFQNIPAKVTVEKIDENYSDIYFSAKLTGISYENLNTDYTAIAYVKGAYGEVLYSSAHLSDDIARIASEEMYKAIEDLDAIEKIVNAGINSLNGVPAADADKPAEFELIAEDSIEIGLSQTQSYYELKVEKSVDADYFMKYTSDNKDVVTVDQNGVIRAISEGSTFILVDCAGKTKRINVTVGAVILDGIKLDGEISEGEYVGETVFSANDTLGVSFLGMTKNGNLYLAFELFHGEFAPLDSSWWNNDNIEFKLNNGLSHTVIFYEGVPTFSNNITHGTAKTVEHGGGYKTIVELCVEGVGDACLLKVGFNGKSFNWLGAIWHDELNLASVTKDGIIIQKPIDVGNGLVLDGVFDESIYTDKVKENMLNVDGNGMPVRIMGTLTEGGVVFGVTVDHTKPVDEHTAAPYDWFTYMNIEFHFNGSGTQFIAIAHNKNSLGNIFCYTKTVAEEVGYTSTIEVFIPYSAIGVSAGVESIDFTARGWFETGWCDLLNSSWNPSHKVSVDGIAAK